MKVRDLILQLKSYPPNTEVFMVYGGQLASFVVTEQEQWYEKEIDGLSQKLRRKVIVIS